MLWDDTLCHFPHLVSAVGGVADGHWAQNYGHDFADVFFYWMEKTC